MKISRLIPSALLSVMVILLTGYVTIVHPVMSLSELLFPLHFIPYDIAYRGGSDLLIFLYYFGFWVVLTLVFYVLLKWVLRKKQNE